MAVSTIDTLTLAAQFCNRLQNAHTNKVPSDKSTPSRTYARIGVNVPFGVSKERAIEAMERVSDVITYFTDLNKQDLGITASPSGDKVFLQFTLDKTATVKKGLKAAFTEHFSHRDNSIDKIHTLGEEAKRLIHAIAKSTLSITALPQDQMQFTLTLDNHTVSENTSTEAIVDLVHHAFQSGGFNPGEFSLSLDETTNRIRAIHYKQDTAKLVKTYAAKHTDALCRACDDIILREHERDQNILPDVKTESLKLLDALRHAQPLTSDSAKGNITLLLRTYEPPKNKDDFKESVKRIKDILAKRPYHITFSNATETLNKAERFTTIEFTDLQQASPKDGVYHPMSVDDFQAEISPPRGHKLRAQLETSFRDRVITGNSR